MEDRGKTEGSEKKRNFQGLFFSLQEEIRIQLWWKDGKALGLYLCRNKGKFNAAKCLVFFSVLVKLSTQGRGHSFIRH